jgi:tellurite resistance-related uncharacterized protein
MSMIPLHFCIYKTTPVFTQITVPTALLSHHNTKAGVYARLNVITGAICYYGFIDENSTTPEKKLIIQAGDFGISPPQYWHRVELLTDDTSFCIDFFSDPQA